MLKGWKNSFRGKQGGSTDVHYISVSGSERRPVGQCLPVCKYDLHTVKPFLPTCSPHSGAQTYIYNIIYINKRRSPSYDTYPKPKTHGIIFLPYIKYFIHYEMVRSYEINSNVKIWTMLTVFITFYCINIDHLHSVKTFTLLLNVFTTW